LGDEFAFAELEVRGDGTDGEVRFFEGRTFAGSVAGTEAIINSGQQRNEPDGVDIEDGLGAAQAAAEGVVAGHGEDVVEAFAVEHPGFGLEAVAVKVLAGEVDDDLFAGIEDGAAEGQGRELRMAAGVVGDGDPVDGGAGDEVVRKGAGFGRGALVHRAADGDEFRGE
jgi:hypothetical protein